MDIARIRTFRRQLRVDAAERTVHTEHGIGLLLDSGPQVYDANYLWTEDSAAAPELTAEAEQVLADRLHRRVVVSDGAPGLAGDFDALGFSLSTHLVLVHTREPDRRVDTSVVRDIPLDELEGARSLATLREPWGSDELAEQLARMSRRVAEVVPTRHFAAIVAGEVAGWCELYLREGVAQIENVEVLDEFRGRGLGRAVVQHALAAAQQEADIVFLEALADDWPRELYAKLGFAAVDRTDYYTRLPHPLTRVRLRTPRLELRVATVAEARRLFRVAEAGIHDPGVMPFEIPWTDTLDEEDFVSHVSAVSDDSIRFVAFLDGEPVGVQAIDVQPEWVTTGSWLGRAYQGFGLGTEMRAAVLTYAFEVRGATVARSGAIAGNPQSLAVSRKLGYEVVGSHVVSPRGEPLEHTDVELRRAQFTSPIAVSMEGTP